MTAQCAKLKTLYEVSSRYDTANGKDTTKGMLVHVERTRACVALG